MKTNKNILLTGGSGTVGFEILKLLSKNPEVNLSVFDVDTPRTRKIYKPFDSKINVIHGSLTNPFDIFRIPDGFDAIIHVGALIPPVADDYPDRARMINVEGTRLLLAHAEYHSPNAFFLYSSSVSVYGDRVDNPFITTEDPIQISEGDAYGQTKIEAEEIIKSGALDYSIFRLSAIMKNHKISKLMFHMPLATQLEICTAEDTARAFVNALEKREELKGQIFNLGGGEKCRIEYKDFLQRSFYLFGLGKLNFPKHAFAYRNFHCGLFADGDKLEEILHFRSDTLDSYFNKTDKETSFLVRLGGFLFAPLIKLYLTFSSEPLQAIRTRNRIKISRFFTKVKPQNMSL